MAGDAVLVTGATGLVGRRLVTRLLRDGATVRALSRSAGRSGLPEPVEMLAWNGRDLPPEALTGARAVVHLAGEPVFGGLMTAERKRRIRESRVESTRSIVESIGGREESDRPAVFLCASAVGYYGSRGEEELAEHEPPGESFLARVCVDWEEAAARVETHGVRRVSLRVGIVMAGEGGALAPMLLPFRLGFGAHLGDGRQWFPWVHVDDVVGLTCAALEDASYVGALNATAPNPVTNRTFTKTLAKTLGRPAFLAIPSAALRLAGKDAADELLGSRRAVPRQALERGYRFAYPDLAEALAAEI